MISLNPITRPTLDGLNKTVANEIKRCMERWNDLQAYLASLTHDDLVALGYDGTEEAYIGSFRAKIAEVISHYEADPGGGSPKYFIELLADPLVF